MVTHLFQFCALLGSMLIPMSFVGVWELSRFLIASILTAVLLIFGKYRIYKNAF